MTLVNNFFRFLFSDGQILDFHVFAYLIAIRNGHFGFDRPNRHQLGLARLKYYFIGVLSALAGGEKSLKVIIAYFGALMA